jgi:hypothetical protein
MSNWYEIQKQINAQRRVAIILYSLIVLPLILALLI